MTATVNGGPPADKPASELWRLLTTLPRPTKEVEFPRKHPVTGEPLSHRVAIRVLTEAELMRARAAADGYAKEMLANPQKAGDANLGYQELYRNECIVELVCLACREPKNPTEPSFPSPAHARKWITSDEFAFLFQAYCDFQAESGPLVSELTTEQMNAWIDRLAEGASTVPLAALSSEARNQLLLHSVSLLRQSRTDSGSPGSLPGASSPSTGPHPQAHPPGSSALPRRAGSLVVPDEEKPDAPVRDE